MGINPDENFSPGTSSKTQDIDWRSNEYNFLLNPCLVPFLWMLKEWLHLPLCLCCLIYCSVPYLLSLSCPSSWPENQATVWAHFGIKATKTCSVSLSSTLCSMSAANLLSEVSLVGLEEISLPPLQSVHPQLWVLPWWSSEECRLSQLLASFS